jgi:membrane protease YdiL (CAAX protease family)
MSNAAAPMTGDLIADGPQDQQPSRRLDPDVPPPPPGVWPLAPAGGGPTGVPAGAPLAGIGLSLAAIGLYLAAQLGLQLAVGLVLVATGLLDPGALDASEVGAPLLALVVLSQLVGLGAVLLLLRRRAIPLRAVVGPVRPLRRNLGIGAGLGVLAIVGSTIVVSALVALSGSEATPDQVLTGDIAETPTQLLLAITAAVVLAPIAEELLFRGLLHRALRGRLAIVPATMISSVLFAVVHVDVAFSQPLALVGLTLVGVLLAVAYERTGGLVVPIAIHAVHNAVTILAVVVTSRLDLDLLAGMTAVPAALAGALTGALGTPS